MWRMVVVLVIVGLCVNTAAALDGSGTEADPWRLKSLPDFNEFAADANYWDDYTRLETDVNLAGRTYTTALIAPDIDSSNFYFQGTPFTGVFDGNDHKIINLTIDDDGAGNDCLGLFGCIGNDGRVSNLGLEGGSIRGEYHVGGLVAVNAGAVSHCYSTTSPVSGDTYVGGLVGRNYIEGSVSNCYSTADVNGTGYDVGGLVGYNTRGGSVSNCYATGAVNGFDGVGGLVGVIWDGSVSSCYSTGDVSGGDKVGGLVGWNRGGSVSNCFWDTDTQTHGITESIGLNEATATNVAGLPTAQMQTRSTFTDAGWDFVEIWNIGEKQTYPYLRVHPTGDINHDDIVNLLDFAIFADHWLEEK